MRGNANLSPWAKRVIRKISTVEVSAAIAAARIGCPPPPPSPQRTEISFIENNSAQRNGNTNSIFAVGGLLAAPGHGDQPADRQQHAAQAPARSAARPGAGSPTPCGKHRRGIDDRRGNRAAHGADAAKAQHPRHAGNEQADGNEDQVVSNEHSSVALDQPMAGQEKRGVGGDGDPRPPGRRPDMVAALRQQTGHRETK